MARKRRIESAGGIHHVFQRGNNGRDIFFRSADRREFLADLKETARLYGWHCLSFCLMTNHFHLIVETDETTLGAGMQRLETIHAQRVNRIAGTYGHVFQGRYGSVFVRSGQQLLNVFRYVAFNPVAALLCADPCDWTWSSHRHLLGDGHGYAAERERVEGLLEPWGGPPGTRYAKLFDPELADLARLAEPRSDLGRPPLESLLAIVPREEAIRTACDYGYRLVDIAACFCVHQSTVSRWLQQDRDRA